MPQQKIALISTVYLKQLTMVHIATKITIALAPILVVSSHQISPVRID